jgi:anthranilate phosphoribosyltransferase
LSLGLFPGWPIILPVLETLISHLASGLPLTTDQVRIAIGHLTNEQITVAVKADFLAALARKGETTEEIAAFVRELRALSVRPVLDEAFRGVPLLDVVGTGGDRLSTFNISTTVALLVSAAGVVVAKHGNRASTSPIGSADVMEALGISFDLGPEEIGPFLSRHGFAFFFAPKYHPAFRHIVPARRLCAERGQGTIFNFLGPLLNPARPNAMLVGVPRPDLCEPFARVLQSLGVGRAMVVCGAVPMEDGTVRYLDELSTLGPTTIAEFYQERGFSVSELQPEAFPLQPAQLADLKGGNREVNVRLIHGVLDGTDHGPRRDIVLLNAAAALLVAGRASSLTAGWDLAASVIDSGRAWSQFQRLTAPLP